MFEFIAGLVTGYLLTWPALVVLLLVGIVFEHKGARGWAVATGLVAMAISYFYFDVALQTILYLAIAYLAVGLVWSFWRYNVYAKETVKWIKTLQVPDKFSETYRQSHIDNLAPSKNLDRITAWIIIWPFSLIENLLGDLINAIQGLVTRVFKGVYSKIYLSHIKSLDV
jgi:hypothetical protein